MPRRPPAPLLLLLLAAVLACLAPAGCSDHGAKLDAFFVRGGLAVTGGDGAIQVFQGDKQVFPPPAGDRRRNLLRLDGGRRLAFFPWRPSESYRLKVGKQERRLTAPQRPSPLLVTTFDLESVRPWSGDRGGAPDTEVRFSPDGSLLGMGSFKGYLRIGRVPTGQVLLKRKIAEGMVKRLAWGKVGGKLALYVGEQSPDCFLYCLEAPSGKEIWRRRLADDLGTGRLGADQRDAIYNLPGVYYLRSLPGGDLLVAATFGRFVGEGYRHDCRIYRLDGRDGSVKWRWPRDMNFPFGITWVGASQAGDTLAIISFNSFSDEKRRGGFKAGTLYCLDGRSGKLRWDYTVPPLAPYYRRVGAWQGVAVSPDGNWIVLGLNDGRGLLFDARPGSDAARRLVWTANVGTPVLVGDIPVAAPLSYAAIGGGTVYFATPGTTIPSGRSRARARRPAPHPFANSLFAYSLGGGQLWQYRAEGSCQGIFLSRDGRLVATAVSQDRSRQTVDQYGLTLFDAKAPGGAADKLIYHYATEGPVFFQADISADRRFLALTESAYSPDQGKTVYGAYRVHVIH